MKRLSAAPLRLPRPACHRKAASSSKKHGGSSRRRRSTSTRVGRKVSKGAGRNRTGPLRGRHDGRARLARVTKAKKPERTPSRSHDVRRWTGSRKRVVTKRKSQKPKRPRQVPRRQHHILPSTKTRKTVKNKKRKKKEASNDKQPVKIPSVQMRGSRRPAKRRSSTSRRRRSGSSTLGSSRRRRILQLRQHQQRARARILLRQREHQESSRQKKTSSSIVTIPGIPARTRNTRRRASSIITSTSTAREGKLRLGRVVVVDKEDPSNKKDNIPTRPKSKWVSPMRIVSSNSNSRIGSFDSAAIHDAYLTPTTSGTAFRPWWLDSTFVTLDSGFLRDVRDRISRRSLAQFVAELREKLLIRRCEPDSFGVMRTIVQYVVCAIDFGVALVLKKDGKQRQKRKADDYYPASLLLQALKFVNVLIRLARRLDEKKKKKSRTSYDRRKFLMLILTFRAIIHSFLSTMHFRSHRFAAAEHHASIAYQNYRRVPSSRESVAMRLMWSNLAASKCARHDIKGALRCLDASERWFMGGEKDEDEDRSLDTAADCFPPEFGLRVVVRSETPSVVTSEYVDLVSDFNRALCHLRSFRFASGVSILGAVLKSKLRLRPSWIVEARRLRARGIKMLNERSSREKSRRHMKSRAPALLPPARRRSFVPSVLRRRRSTSSRGRIGIGISRTIHNINSKKRRSVSSVLDDLAANRFLLHQTKPNLPPPQLVVTGCPTPFPASSSVSSSRRSSVSVSSDVTDLSEDNGGVPGPWAEAGASSSTSSRSSGRKVPVASRLPPLHPAATKKKGVIAVGLGPRRRQSIVGSAADMRKLLDCCSVAPHDPHDSVSRALLDLNVRKVLSSASRKTPLSCFRLGSSGTTDKQKRSRATVRRVVGGRRRQKQRGGGRRPLLRPFRRRSEFRLGERRILYARK